MVIGSVGLLLVGVAQASVTWFALVKDGFFIMDDHKALLRGWELGHEEIKKLSIKSLSA